MLLLVDLDNTLVDRTSAFSRWARGFVQGLGRAPHDAEWLITADCDGYASRSVLAEKMKYRFGIRQSNDTLVQTLLFDHVGLMTMEADNLAALSAARQAGCRIGLVTNGTVAQQTRKVHELGLGPYVDAVVISDDVGTSKPARRIFEVAAHRLNASLDDGGWMVGDHPKADIAGGRSAGLQTGWVSRGRSWPSGEAPPTMTGDTPAQVIDAVVRSRQAL
ncbi:MAG TPA: HAD family hydrolase [Arthrobacter sp.]|nr:HAD family hydrolase [Arthrobacter sp.]